MLRVIIDLVGVGGVCGMVAKGRFSLATMLLRADFSKQPWFKLYVVSDYGSGGGRVCVWDGC